MNEDRLWICRRAAVVLAEKVIGARSPLAFIMGEAVGSWPQLETLLHLPSQC